MHEAHSVVVFCDETLLTKVVICALLW